MSVFYEIDDIEFCYNTAEEGKAAKAEVKKIITAMQAQIEKLNEYPERLQKAIIELEILQKNTLSIAQKNRIISKIEGVKLALGYFEETTR